METGNSISVYYFGGEPFEITKKRDGFLVVRVADRRSEYLSFVEGLLWRIFQGIPKRIAHWPAPSSEGEAA